MISDDATSGLDVTVQAQVLELLQQLVGGERAARCCSSRATSPLPRISASRIAVIYAGEIMELAPRDAFFERPAHPYSIMLLAAFSHSPELRRRWTRARRRADGRLPGRRLHLRRTAAPARSAVCRTRRPPLAELAPGHYVRCHFPVETCHERAARGAESGQALPDRRLAASGPGGQRRRASRSSAARPWRWSAKAAPARPRSAAASWA